MELNDMVLLSVDDHVLEPAGLFNGRVPLRHAGETPKVVVDDAGIERWMFQSKLLSAVGENALMGKPLSERQREPRTYAEMRPACSNVHERARDMDANGQWGAMCFPTFTRFAGQVFLDGPDKDLSLACLRAYNDWHLEEWAGAYPDRFIPLGLVPLWDPELAAAEVHRLAERSCTAVCFSENPSALGLPSVHSHHWDPFFAACVETGTVPCLHLASSSRVPITSLDAPTLVHLSVLYLNAAMAAADWLLSPVFDDFPTLRVALSEGGVGWVPSLLQSVGHHIRQNDPWLGGQRAGLNPTQRFHDHFAVCFVDDPIGIADRSRIGTDIIMWEGDYPHPDCSWPASAEQLWPVFAGCTDTEVDAITHRNAARIFRFDPFARRSRSACTVGALRSAADGRALITGTQYTGADKRLMFARAAGS